MASREPKGKTSDFEVQFSERAKKHIITLCAFDLFINAHEEGLVTDEELAYLREKYVDIEL